MCRFYYFVFLDHFFANRRRSRDSRSRPGRQSYVDCKICGKAVLRESLTKHTRYSATKNTHYKEEKYFYLTLFIKRDVHELSNKKTCGLCGKVLSGPFSLKEHVAVVHQGLVKAYF